MSGLTLATHLLALTTGMCNPPPIGTPPTLCSAGLDCAYAFMICDPVSGRVACECQELKAEMAPVVAKLQVQVWPTDEGAPLRSDLVSRKISLNGCNSTPGPTVKKAEIRINGALVSGGSGYNFEGAYKNCATDVTHVGPLVQQLAVTLDLWGWDGSHSVATVNKAIDDKLIVSIGDSFASGEGNPDVRRTVSCNLLGICSETPAQWLDPDCHRSRTNGPRFFSEYLDATFRQTACSGDEVSNLTTSRDYVTFNPDYGTYGETCSVYGPANPYNAALGQVYPPGCTPAYVHVPSQLESVAVMTCTGGDCSAGVSRPIDNLIVSVGGNDAGFGRILENCIVHSGCPTTWDSQNMVSYLSSHLRALGNGYDALGTAIRAKLGPAVREVWLTEYPHPMRAAQDTWCEMISVGTPAGTLKITPQESASASQFAARPLQLVARRAAARNGWVYVSGAADQSITHGLCAASPWFVSNHDALILQGADMKDTTDPYLHVPGMIDGVSRGFAHPNAAGHRAYADWLMVAWQGGMNQAVFDGALSTPACGTVSYTCSSGALLSGRGNTEFHSANVLGGTFVDDPVGIDGTDPEAIQAIRIWSVDGADLRPLGAVRIEVDVIASASFGQDRVEVQLGSDFIQSNSTLDLPAWTVNPNKFRPISPVFSATPTRAGASTLLFQANLLGGPLQAVRASIGREGANGGRIFRDTDDLVFPVNVAGCFNGVKDADEGGKDCGSVCPDTCATGTSCRVGGDCQTGYCTSTGICAVPTCTDAVKNGSEGDVDCGGYCAAKCATGKGCQTGADCRDLVCSPTHTCAAPTCSDGVKNGTESDVDCGAGAACGKLCGLYKTCGTSADCTSDLTCDAGLCVAVAYCGVKGTACSFAEECCSNACAVKLNKCL